MYTLYVSALAPKSYVLLYEHLTPSTNFKYMAIRIMVIAKEHQWLYMGTQVIIIDPGGRALDRSCSLISSSSAPKVGVSIGFIAASLAKEPPPPPKAWTYMYHDID